jgi:hypothetical protein
MRGGGSGGIMCAGLANAPVVGPVIREHMKSLPKAPKSTAVITINIPKMLAQEE